ncbi:MAG: 3-isopropylmalate dehydratase large subunit [Alphaproteobacteria bacterium]|nr:3-isopropylmalate dehydratase large subunit [Alphaproteobacteria bacterium]
MASAQTMFDKIWQRHAIAAEQDETLLYVARCLIHEGSSHTFDRMGKEGRKTAEPDKVFAFSDHYVPTTNQRNGIGAIGDPKIRNMVEMLTANCRKYGIRHFNMGDPDQGILHVAGPEQGVSIPGIVLVGADSHTATHGAFGNLSFGAGASEIYHIMVTQTLWQRKPKAMRIRVDHRLPFGVAAKDVILAIIAKIGHGGASGHIIEYAGEALTSMTMEQRMTVCNMSIEAGGRAGMVAPDDETFAYVHGRAYAPKGADWDSALAHWKTLPSDDGAVFDAEVTLDGAEVAPMVTWGINPEHALPITGRVPSPDAGRDAATKTEIADALEYMDLKPGAALDDIAIDRVFIGSCTNSRIEDLRAAAEVAKLGKAKIPAWIVPGSATIKRNAEAEGLDRVFTAAGFEWRDPGCSLCTAINGDMLRPGERCASTSNRNFKGRQGLGGRTHLVSPAMAAAAAITGKLTDVRKLAKGA